MLIPISVFLIVTAVIYGAARLLMGASRNQPEVLDGGQRRPLVFGPLTPALAGALPCPQATRQQIEREMRQAGYYHRYAAAEYLALRNAVVLGWLSLVAVLVVMLSTPGSALALQLLAVGAGGAALFYGAPRLILKGSARSRVQRIQYGLPDALDMITMCLVGGVPLRQAIGRVSDELVGTHADLACELRIIGRQMEARSLEGALRQFSQRMDTPEVRGLTAIVAQTERQGANVAAALEEFADGVRKDRRQRAEEQGNKTSVKLLLPLVFCLAPPVYIMLLTPAAMELRKFVMEENQPGGVLSPIEAEAFAPPTMDLTPPQRP